MDEEIQIYPSDHPKGQAILRQKRLTLNELAVALYIFESVNSELKNLFGLDKEGFYGSYAEDWEEGDHVIFIPWVQIYEILGRVKEGTTREFMESGGEFN